jgi:uncharacterized membrane protein YhfC
MKRWAILGIVVLVVVLIGCTAEPAALPDPTPTVQEGGWITGATLDEEEAGERVPFTVSAEEAGKQIGVDARGILMEGEIRVQLVDSEGERVWSQSVTQLGPFGINTQVTLPDAGEHQLGLAWSADTQASYNLQWKPHAIEVSTVKPTALVGGIGMILVALGALAYVSLRAPAWKYLGFGALAWLITVALKFLWAIPINTTVYTTLTDTLPETVGNVIFYLYVGLLTGIFEVGGTWLALRYTPLGRVRWRKAQAFAVGFGAVEALILGAISLANMLVAINSPNLLPLAALEGLAKSNNLLYALAPVVERLFTILIHVASNVLLFYGLQISHTEKRGARYFWYAFVFKSGIDVVAAFAQMWGLETLGKIWAIEAVVILWGVAGYWITRRVRERYLQAEEAPATD